MRSQKAQHEATDIIYPSVIPFILVHLACFGAFFSGVTWPSIVLCVALYWLRLFAIGAGYHRYFSHRAYATSRVFQFLLACLAQSSGQKGVLWWAAKHRHHHKHSDTPHDVHSPRHSGFLYSHLGWMFTRQHDTADLSRVSDWTRFPELRWLNQYELVPAIALALLCLLFDGWAGLVVGFFWSTVLVYHATFCINSLAHVVGRKRYVTADDSRNNWLLALLTMGEGWHNNHHAYQSSVRQGFRWWEFDATYHLLSLMSRLGLVWNLKTPPEEVIRNEQRLGSAVVNRAAEQLAAQFNAERIARAIRSSPAYASEQEIVVLTTPSAINAFAAWLPGRAELRAKATSMFVRTKSIDEIAHRGYELLCAAVSVRLTQSTA
jgi:stearoyl-CoA desaturase (Delta-9 desaturase)